MGFKSFITSGWNRLKSDVHQGLIGAKNAAHHVWNATKKGLIGAKNFAVNHPKAVGMALHALTPFATAFNPALGALTATGANIFSNMPKGTITDKLEKISEQFARGALKPNVTTGGSSTAQAAVDSRRAATHKNPSEMAASKRTHKWIPFRGV